MTKREKMELIVSKSTYLKQLRRDLKTWQRKEIVQAILSGTFIYENFEQCINKYYRKDPVTGWVGTISEFNCRVESTLSEYDKHIKKIESKEQEIMDLIGD